MQAVILAAGQSSRMYPFENEIHKSMIRIMGKPILYYTIEALKRSKIFDLIIVTSGKSKTEQYFGDGKKLGVSIQYVFQEKPEGAGDALLLAGKYITGDFFLLNASHVEIDTLTEDLLNAKDKDTQAVLLARKKTTGVIQGVLKFKGRKVEEIVEKPKIGEEPSSMCVVGVYLFEKEFLKALNNTPKEHYQLEKAISSYAKNNSVVFLKTSKETVTLRYPWDLLGIKNYLFKSLRRSISVKSKIAKTAEIIGEVMIQDNVIIMEGVRIKGPCFIGKGTVVGNNALLRNGVNIGENCLVGSFMEVKNTIIMDESTTHSGFIGDSVIGEKCKIAAQFCTGNVRLDRGIIKTVVKGESIETGVKFLGVFVGAGSNIGIKVSAMPGIIIGRNATIGPSTVVMKNVPSDTKYYTKFQEIISKKNVLQQVFDSEVFDREAQTESAQTRGAQDFQKSIVLFDIDYTLFDTRKFKDSQLQDYNIYEEVMGILMQLSGLVNLGIFSKGETDFQKTKLEKTGMMQFFKENNVHIFNDKDANLINVLEKYKDSKLFLVDDKLGILYSAKKHMPQVFTIWVKRGPFAKAQKPIEGFSPDEQVENLSEIVRIVRSN
ncbi:MAG: sugar phosphate nucleotidyltransferase [Candidatus Levybacteria bacterium]|nr:sugar phosphate nucleotidyltransferase [Candidatus Levybacteria bacterium]